MRKIIEEFCKCGEIRNLRCLSSSDIKRNGIELVKHCINYNHYNTLNYLIKIRQVDISEDRSILNTAIRIRKIKYIKYVLLHNCVKSVDPEYLKMLVKEDRLDILTLFINNGILLKWEDYGYYLKEAINAHNIPMLELLLDKYNGDVNVDNGIAIKTACSVGDIRIVKYLHKKNAILDIDNNSAIREAGKCGHVNVIRYLAENGCNIGVNNIEPIRTVASNLHQISIDYFVSKGIEIKVTREELDMLFNQVILTCMNGCNTENIKKCINLLSKSNLESIRILTQVRDNAKINKQHNFSNVLTTIINNVKSHIPSFG